MSKNYSILFIQEDKSELDSNSALLTELFRTTTIVSNKDEALKLLKNNIYDIVIKDMSVDFLAGFLVVKELHEKNDTQKIVTLVDPEHEGTLQGLVDLGASVFLLTPSDFEQALGVISNMSFEE